METTLLEHEGIQLRREGTQFFLVYDEGELSVKIRKRRITGEEAALVLRHPKSAYSIIVRYQNIERGLL